MNNTERALEWAKAMLEYSKQNISTYEDTVGTGDLTEDERKDVYEAMESDIDLFQTLVASLEWTLQHNKFYIGDEFNYMGFVFRLIAITQSESNGVYYTLINNVKNEITRTIDELWQMERIN